jgi:hypothetical protein
MASNLRVDQITSSTTGSVSIGTATFTGGLSGDITGLNVTGVITATTLNQNLGAGSSITIGDTFIKQGAVGLGTTDTAGRNAGVGTAVGTLIYNTTTDQLEVYSGPSGWVVGSTVPFTYSVTPGSIVADTSTRPGYTVYSFTSPGTFTVTGGSGSVEYLVVGGGGGGGSTFHGGGGGAGALRFSDSFPVTVGSYPVIVGSGGAGGPNVGYKAGSVGSASTFGSITSPGGGGGGGGNDDGGNGGSGGSGGGSTSTGTGSTRLPGPATGDTGGTGNSNSPANGWGNAGGQGTNQTYAGGGGGAASAGGGAPTNGNGGNGLAYTITGNPVSLAGGGGGSKYGTSGRPSGGTGGGGQGGVGQDGYVSNVADAASGTVNTGGGGGGSEREQSGSYTRYAGGNGGSGIVVIAIPTS